MSPFKLSIIIPTKNRQFYCVKAIEQVLKNTTECVQIVIQDNSDDDSVISSFVKNINSNRVLYNHTKQVLSFVDNFNQAVDLANGDYVCMIGDDDGVLPNIEDALEYVIHNNIDCFIPAQSVVYIWPSNNPIVQGVDNGYLCISNIKRSQKTIDCNYVLRQLLKQGFQNYQHLDVPRLYHGIVKRELLDKIKNEVGYYFGGLTPDMYMVVALSVVGKRVIASQMPVTISGICPKSGSSASATGEHTGKLENAPHFVGHSAYTWSDLVPKIYTVETIWADTGIHALQDFNQEDFIRIFNYKKLLVLLKIKYPQFKQEYSDFVDGHARPSIFLFLTYRLATVFSFFKKAVKRVFRKKDSVKKFYDVKDIDSATTIAKRFITIE